jgi:gluconate 5-dehydrogenase
MRVGEGLVTNAGSAGLFSLAGKVALVTGSTRSLGWSIARGLARAGAHVVVNGTRPEAAAARVKELTGDGLKASAAAFDVANAESAGAAFGKIEAELGRLDILVNNAGITKRTPLGEVAPEDWQRILDIDLTACFRHVQMAVPVMLRNGGGRIIMIASALGLVGRAETAAYGAAKGGLISLMRSLAAELGPQGILCNAIAPGFMATELTQPLLRNPKFDGMVRGRTPLHRWGDPEELVGPAIFLASPASSYVNGHVLMVDGGMTVSVGTEL